MSQMLSRFRDAYIDPYGRDAIDVLYQLQDVAADFEQAEDLLRDLMFFLEHSVAPATDLRSFAQQPQALAIALSVARCSRYGWNLIVQDQRRFWSLIDSQAYCEILERGHLQEALDKGLTQVHDDDARMAYLNRFYQYHILRIMMGDLQDRLSFGATVHEISDLAEVIVQAALDIAEARLRARFGVPGCGFVVLGLGKLGGRELNYSSDLDLIFCYGERGRTTEQGCDHADYFQRLGRELISILDESRPAGRLFRIDMRLRPEGAAGELVLTRQETINYYYTKGRAWERQALIKARPIAGDLALGTALLTELRPWVFPETQSLEVLENARRMRRRIEERVDDDNVKTGAGGIRDIEFLVQFFQLVYGGVLPELRQRATLPVLHRLGDLGLLRRDEAQQLEEHYTWLRMVEHRLQLWEARQVHAVPDSLAERRHLARRCGFEGPDALTAFEQALQRVREEVRALAERYYLTSTAEDDRLFVLLTEELPEPALREILEPVGFRDPIQAARILRELAHEPFFVLAERRTEQHFLQLLPALLRLFQDSPCADDTLHEFARIVAVVGGRSWFYEELGRRPLTLTTLVSLAGWATYLVQYLERFPGLVDDLIEHLGESVTWNEAQMAGARELLDADHREDRAIGRNLAYLHARELTHIAWRDLQGGDFWTLCRAQTDLAQALMQLTLEQAQVLLGPRLGWPVEGDGRALRFAIIGLGKLGAGELTYASDMDVLFVCDPGGRCPDTERDADYYWVRLAQRVIALLQESQIYEVDARLRPWGSQGPLVVSLPALRQYWSQERDLWERMAMTRMRFLAGSSALAAEAIGLVHAAALTSPVPADAAAQVRSMRERLERSVDGRDHLKRGAGGYVDIEFAIQYASLGADPHALPADLGAGAVLARLKAMGRISVDQEDRLHAALLLLRRIEARMRLASGRAVSSIPTDPEGRRRIARQCGYATPEQLDVALFNARTDARACYEALIT